MHYLIILLLLLLPGCSNQGDSDVPKILGVSIEAKDTCNKGGTKVSCFLKTSPSDVTTVNVRITGSDDAGIAGYYITHEDSLIPANWTTIAPAETNYDETVTYGLPSADGIKQIKVWLKDTGGKISDVSTAEVLVVSGQVKEWVKEAIDMKSDFGNGLLIHALKVDSNGNPHIVFGEHEIYHAVSDSNGWSVENSEGIDIGGSSAGTVIDSSGYVHLSYIDGNHNIVYAANSSGQWTVTTVDSSGHASGVPDIDYGIGGVHISYYDAGGRDLKYAVCASDCADIGNWETMIVDSTGDVGNYSSVKTGTDGSVHITFFDNTNNSLKYITADSDGSWGEPVTVDGNSGGYSDIALDSDNNPHIAYYDRTNGTSGVLKYAENITGVWDITEVDKDSIAAGFLSIAVDSGKIAHISYFDSASNGLKYASSQSGSGAWGSVALDTEGTTGLYNQISMGADNKVHISYFNSDNKLVKYAVCPGNCTDLSNWKIVGVLSSGDAGRYNSVAMDTDGDIHISYLGGGDLRYADNTKGTWRTSVVDSNGASGEFSSIAADSAGVIHLGYYDGNKQLKYATCLNAGVSDCNDPENWTFAVVDKGINAGFSYVSLSVDSGAGLHISYYDIAEGSLKYAFCDTDCTADNNSDGIGDHWGKVFVDKSEIVNSVKKTDVGQYNSIATTAAGDKIYISYFDRVRGALKVAECGSNCTEDSNKWKPETIDEGEIVPVSGSIDSRGLFTSVKVDNDGYVHISYFNETTGDLKYATNKSNDWVTAVVDNYERAGLYTNLSIGADNKVYIVYYRYSDGLCVLKYAVCSSKCTSDNIDNITVEPEKDGIADNWTTYILDLFDNPGMFASLTTDTDKNVHVIYYDPDTGGLNYTVGK